MRALLCLAVLWCVGLQSLEAQWRRPRPRDFDERFRHRAELVEFGVRGGYDFDEHVGSAGAQVRVPLMRQLLLVPSGDVFFSEEDSETEWQLNADLLVRPAPLGGLYAGVGAAFMNRDFDGDGDAGVEVGYNLLAGLEGNRLFDARVRPFVEARWTEVEDYGPFRLLLGIHVPVR